jgi:hypothetical protein
MDPIFPELIIPWQILQAKVDESPNKHFPLVISYFCKFDFGATKIFGLSFESGAGHSHIKVYEMC